MHWPATMLRCAPRPSCWLPIVGVLLPVVCWHSSTARAFDLKRTEEGALIRWHTDTVTVAVVRPALGSISRDELARATDIALDAWRGMPGLPALVSCPTLRDDLAADRAWSARCGADVTIEVASEWPYEPSRLAVTLDTFVATTGEMLSARVLVNPRYPTAVLDEAVPDRAEYDLASTLAHELGHVLGLAESGFREATMWPDGGRGDTIARTLDVDDEQAITTLYYDEPTPPLLYACQAAPAARTALVTPAALAVALGIVALRPRRRRLCRRAGAGR